MLSAANDNRVSPLPCVCKECGVAFERTGRMVRSYCSESCRLKRKARLRKNPQTPVCEMCHQEMVRTSSSQKFCSDCRGAARRLYTCEYNAANDNIVRAAKREYMANLPKEQRLMWSRAYIARNRDDLNARRMTPEVRKRNSDNLRKRYQESPRLRVHGRMASAVHQALKSKKAGRKWETIVGYTLYDLTKHLERQFVAGMCWENMGDWHIDHIVPKSSFVYNSDNDPGFKAAWAITNLRPLWASENQSKSDKRLFLI